MTEKTQINLQKLKETHRQEQWLAIAGGINILFLEDLEKNGPVSPSKFNKFKTSWEKIQERDALIESKLKAVKDARECFRDRSRLDHFLYISGIGYVLKIEYVKPALDITEAVINS